MSSPNYFENSNPESSLFITSLKKNDKPSFMKFYSNLHMKLHNNGWREEGEADEKRTQKNCKNLKYWTK